MPQPEPARNVFCSGCYEIFLEPDIHVVPTFNDSVGNFVTGYRCDKCWLSALDDFAARVRSAESIDQLAQLAAFFERHNVFLHEFRRGDAIDVVRPLLLQMIELMRSERLKLQIGPTVPWPGSKQVSSN